MDANFLSQAEYGIRACHVTGGQTCALPISAGLPKDDMKTIRQQIKQDPALKLNPFQQYDQAALRQFFSQYRPKKEFGTKRSEERRVGKEGKCTRAREQERT